MSEQAARPKCRKCGGSNVRKNGHYGAEPDRANREGIQKWRCKDCGWQGGAIEIHGVTPGIDPDRVERLLDRVEEKLESGRLVAVITSAQNATPVHAAFFEALRHLCRHRRAQLAVIPYRYHNPTSIWTDKDKGQDWWAKEVVPYLLDQELRLHKHLTVMGAWKMQPTAVNPLEGLESITGDRSGIFGHPKLHLKSVATPQSKLPKLLTTTGSCTTKNYSPTKAGKKGEFHHTFGATIVEIKDGLFHMRQINALNDGSFIDLDTAYDKDGYRPAPRPMALVMGDIHQPFTDPAAMDAVFGEHGIIHTLRPEKLVLHDVHDMFEVSHHHDKEPFIRFAKFQANQDNLSQGLQRTFKWLEAVAALVDQAIVVRSNHHDHLGSFVKRAHPFDHPRNAVFLATLQLDLLKATTWTNEGPHTPDAFAFASRYFTKSDRIRFLDYDESCVLAGIEVSYHGHKGPGGKPGTLTGFRRIGAKTVIAHGHGPGIDEGCYKVGHNRLERAGYNAGSPSDWLTTDCIIYANGKRTLIHKIKGQWRG